MTIRQRLGAAARPVLGRTRDLVGDVVLELTARRSRTVLIVLAVALSTGALLASLGISTIAARQISADMAASTLDLVTVSVTATDTFSEPDPTYGVPAIVNQFPTDADARATALDVVTAAGRRLDMIPSPETDPTSTVPGDPHADPIPVVGLTPGYLDAAQAPLRSSRTWFLGTDQNVVILGHDAAERLGVPVSDDPTGHQVHLGRTAYQVVDFIEPSESARVDLAQAVVIPYTRALVATATDSTATMLVRVAPGAGSPVAAVIRQAIRPDAPERLSASQVVNLSQLRRGVDTQLGRLAGGIGSFLLILTSLLIANSMIVSVTARTTEIGLRRALGTSRAGVSAVFWCEGLFVGLIGGLTGSAIAATLTVAVAALNHWSVALNPWLYLGGPLAGGLIGLLASAYPAARAARIHPAIAVRSD